MHLRGTFMRRDILKYHLEVTMQPVGSSYWV